MIDCAGSSEQRQNGVEFQGAFYSLAGPEEEAAFRKDPLRYLVNQQFPGERDLPHRINPTDLPSCTMKLALKGYCPVSILDAEVGTLQE